MTLFLDVASQCPICRSDQIGPAFQVHYWRENLFQFFDCQSCRATFANPMPEDKLISQGNDALVRYYQQGRTLEQEFREARQAYLRGKMLARKLQKWKRRGRLLELGCFHGFFSLGFKENSDWEVEGLEISTELQSFVEGQLGIRCHLGTLEAADIPSESYDFVVCHDLIEHINRPETFLSQLTRIVKPGGRIQIITPNGLQDLAFTRRAFQAGQPLTMLLNHIMYFAPNTLKYAFENRGFKIVNLYCYDVRYAPKDFGWFGLGKPKNIPKGPLLAESILLEEKKTLSYWTPEKLQDLRSHPKVSMRYGFFKEALPKAFTLRVPYRIGIGHEIYALVEKVN